MTGENGKIAGLVLLSLLALAVAFGCDNTGDDDDSSAGDDDDAAVSIKSTYPQDGATDFYHRNNIVVEWEDTVSGASIVLKDAGGAEIAGDSAMNADGDTITFNPLGDSITENLVPSTPYTATIAWDGADSVDLGFTTSSVGTPAGDVQGSIVGEDYLLDLSTAIITEPPGVGSLLTQYAEEALIVFHVTEIDEGAGEFFVYGGIVEKQGTDYTQDMCEPTISLTDAEAALWDNPYFQIGPTDFFVSFQGYEVTIDDFKVSGSFAQDGSMFVGGTLDGQVDTRIADELIDPGAKEGAACELLASLGIVCEDCPSGEGPFCLTVSGYDIIGTPIEISVVNEDHPDICTPDSQGLATTGLVQITESDLDKFVANGCCDPLTP